jgi:hypothetical protein
MRTSIQPRLMLRFCRTFFLTTALVLQIGVLLAEKAPPLPAGPKYDLQTEMKIKGTVLDVKAAEKEKDSLHLTIKSGEETMDVLLCPKSFLDDMGTTFAKGDEISLTGSKVKVEDASLILAREIEKGDDKLILRDAKGAPVWNWKH